MRVCFDKLEWKLCNRKRWLSLKHSVLVSIDDIVSMQVADKVKNICCCALSEFRRGRELDVYLNTY